MSGDKTIRIYIGVTSLPLGKNNLIPAGGWGAVIVTPGGPRLLSQHASTYKSSEYQTLCAIKAALDDVATHDYRTDNPPKIIVCTKNRTVIEHCRSKDITPQKMRDILPLLDLLDVSFCDEKQPEPVAQVRQKKAWLDIAQELAKVEAWKTRLLEQKFIHLKNTDVPLGKKLEGDAAKKELDNWRSLIERSVADMITNPNQASVSVGHSYGW